MDKRKKWQTCLIIAVLVLTVYNILPTIFYYTKPLKSPITPQRSEAIATSIMQRTNGLEAQSIDWLRSFCALIHITPLSISKDPEQPQFLTVNLKNAQDAQLFRQFLPRAGSLISFTPAQLSLYDSSDNTSKSVVVQRRIPFRFDLQQLQQYFQFSEKYDASGIPTPLYRALVNDRALEIGMALGGPSENALYLQGIAEASSNQNMEDLTLFLAQDIVSFAEIYGENSPITRRYFSSFSQIEQGNRSQLIDNFSKAIDQLRLKTKTDLSKINLESNLPSDVVQQQIDQLKLKEKALSSAADIIARNRTLFIAGQEPWNFASLGALLQTPNAFPVQTISLQNKNPYIAGLLIDWNNEKIILQLHSDLKDFTTPLTQTNYQIDRSSQFLYNAIAAASRQTDEKFQPAPGGFEVSLNQLTGSKNFLAMKLSTIAEAQLAQLKDVLHHNWNPKHPDLDHAHLPIYDYATYDQLPPEQKQLALVIYAPALYGKVPQRGFRMNSIYVIAKGMEHLIDHLQANETSPHSQHFIEEFSELRSLLQKNGFVGYSGKALAFGSESSSDFIFEARDYYQTVLNATREDFTVHGTKRYAILEFTDVEQRILTENKIDNRIHEDLLKWRDDYLAAQLAVKGVSKFDVPKPTQNVYWSNFKLSTVKYFRGDDRKILHWGLDLSGGKTVQIELRDTNNRLVTNEEDLKQGINELYSRVNKMGVSEVNIRQEGNYITLDFPGSQGLSASELVKASTMYFHIVNEKFSPSNPLLAEASNRFLQEIWNEAVVTGRKTTEDLNFIAWKHLYGDSVDPNVIQSQSEAAQLLYNQGLRFRNPQDPFSSPLPEETYSKIALFRGDDFTEWQGQTHPLLIVFNNFALEGSHLEQVHAGYDPSKGNFLSFTVQGSYTAKDGRKVAPRDDLYAWTSRFSKEKVINTPLAAFSGNKGWRMAVILNGSVISAPTLDSALRDSAMITGSFTQREVNQLEADLKAGSLSFTPYILSEKNVSPELGAKEKSTGIFATCLSLILVIIVMVSYYRFGGFIASIAVLFNLIIMWATLQNLEATMTLAGIAGIILTVGMAVDANVLVFERIREEFAVSGRIASAVHAGYRKAFSAILDSNLTTIIAALILLNFDSGPIKGFAVTLIVGIVSSMFTALFMTRFFFARWVKNPEHKELRMANWFKPKNYDFLKYTKITLIFSAVIIGLGCAVATVKRNTLLGMDFKGGYALNIELQSTQEDHYRLLVEKALINAGATPQEFQIRELSPSNHIRIFLSRSLQLPGRPFYGMPRELDISVEAPVFESNPKIVWILNALTRADLSLTPASLQYLDKNWTEVSGQMSDTMRNSAIIGLSIALLCILIYITLRFEFNYAISATLCLAHDLLFTVGAMALLHACGLPIQLDLNTVAALMTMVGYSLNDTIIVFDRIREDVLLMKKSSFKEIINHALNITLSRTLMTSGTTLLVLIPLIVLGGSTLFGFALVMAIGVIFGTLSSLFIAAPLMKFFHDRAERNGSIIESRSSS